MSVHRAQVVMLGKSLLPEDSCTNTFHFEGSGADLENIYDMLVAFYNDDGDGGYSILSTWLGSSLDGEAWINIYDLADPEPRVPVFSDSFQLSYSTGTFLPQEVALVLSFQGDQVSGEPQARKRNRIYLGPLTDGALGTDGRPGTGIIASGQGAMADLWSASNASLSWTWVAYSPTNGTAVPVTNGWVDNAWDTQRRRGTVSTTRTVWPV